MEQKFQTFLFADLAGFTALTEAHGDQAGADLAERFVGAVRALLPADGAQLVKTIGDEVMVRTDGAEEAVDLGRRIVDQLAVHGSPPVRVGIHSGSAVAVGEDWFGAAVNLASRVASAARTGEVLITEATRAALGDAETGTLTARGERYFKHVPDPVPVFSAARAGGRGHELEVDPVCRMAVDVARSPAQHDHRGRSYTFCSAACAETFADEPRRFVGRSARARAARAGFHAHLRVFVASQLAFIALWGAVLAFDGTAFPWFLFIAVGWGIPLALHYRAVRAVL